MGVIGKDESTPKKRSKVVGSMNAAIHQQRVWLKGGHRKWMRTAEHSLLLSQNNFILITPLQLFVRQDNAIEDNDFPVNFHVGT